MTGFKPGTPASQPCALTTRPHYYSEGGRRGAGDSLIKVGTDVRARALGILGVNFCPGIRFCILGGNFCPGNMFSAIFDKKCVISDKSQKELGLP